METTTPDRRIKRTQRELRKALFVLIVERGYEPLTIQDIAERANVSRPTFYLHYTDKADLLADGIQELLGELKQNVEPNEADECSYIARCTRIFEHVATHHDLYRALFGKNGPPGVATLWTNYFAELLQRRVFGQASLSSNLNVSILAAHAAGSLLGLINYWIEQNLTPSAAAMGEIYWRLMAETKQIQEVGVSANMFDPLRAER